MSTPSQFLPRNTAPPNGMNLFSLLRALRRRWVLASAVGLLLAAAAATAVWFLLPPPNPSATVLMEIPKGVRGQVGSHPDQPLEMRTQIALIRDPLVLNATLSRPEIARLPIVRSEPDALEWLGKAVTAGAPRSQEILEVTVTGRFGDDPEQLKKLAEGIRATYLRDVVGEAVRERGARIDTLTELERIARERLDALLDESRPIAQEFGTRDPQALQLHRLLLEERYFSARRQLRQIDEKLMLLKAQEVAHRNTREGDPGAEAEIPETLIEAAVEQDERVLELVTRYEALSRQLSEYEKVLKSTDPQLGQLRGRIAAAKSEVAALREKLQVEKVAEVRDQLSSDFRTRIDDLQERIRLYEDMKETFTDELKILDAQRTTTGENALKIEDNQLKIEVVRANLTGILQRIESLQQEKEAPPRVRTLGDARINTIDEDARKLKFAAMGGAGAFGVGLLLVSLLELRLRRLDTLQSVTQELGLRLIGTVPPPPKQARLVGGTGSDTWQVELADSIDYARTTLLYAPLGPAIQTVQVTSAISGEGKTSFAAHLALSLARSGHRTLLVDADFYNPSTGRLFHTHPGPGLSEILKGESILSEAVEPGPVENMYILPAGEDYDERAERSLARNGMAGAIEQMKREYEMIVIDTSPVLPLADSVQIARHVDGVVLCVRNGYSRLHQTEEAHRRLASFGCNVLGAVVNGIRDFAQGYGSGVKYRSGRRHQQAIAGTK